MSGKYPPGPEGSLISGSLGAIRSGILEFLLACKANYGDVVHVRFGPFIHGYVLNHPDDVRYILVDAPEKVHKGPGLKRNTVRSIGNGLLTSEDEFHTRQRRLVQPAFHATRINTYGETMVQQTLQLLDSWRPGETREIHHEMMRLTLAIISRTMFDADVAERADRIGEAVTMGIVALNKKIVTLFTLPDWLPTPNNRKRDESARILDSTIMQIINERRASHEDKGDLLSMLLMAVDEEDGGQMTNKQVRDEAMTLFIAGHETTANALTWAFYLLSEHPEAEAKLVEELDRELAGRAPTVSDLGRLPYTEYVIKETMRLYPPAWVLTRQVMESLEIGGYSIAKGSIVLVSPYVIQRDPRYFDDPDLFYPDRWVDGLEKRIPRYAYFPFGGGPRVCIGQSFAMMEARLILATILQRYRISLAPGQPVETLPLITLRPKYPMNMRLALREKVEETEFAR